MASKMSNICVELLAKSSGAARLDLELIALPSRFRLFTGSSIIGKYL